MGKASRWLRNLFLPSGWKSRKAKDRGAADADCQSVLSAPLPSLSQAAAPNGKEKRRWSFRRPGAGASCGGAQGQGPLASSSSHCFSEAEVHVVVVAQEQQDQQQQQVAAATAVVVVPDASYTAGAVVVPLPAPSGKRSGGDRDAEAAAAAVKIQAAFRSYLARKALCALRGMVKLQAMVRGQLVRRQANLTLRRMQALVHAQRRARAERLRLLAVEDGTSSRHQATATATATTQPPPSRRSPQHPRSRKALDAAERGSEENDVRIVEVDDGAPRPSARRNSSSCHHYSTSTTTPSRITPAKAEDPCQKVSPTTPSSARTDASARTPSGRFDINDASFASASEPTPVPLSRRRPWRADPPFFPSYMANTESSRTKARSQSAPRQRLSSASETTSLAATAASPSPSCCERTPSRGGGGGGVPRRASLDPMDLPGGGAPSSRRMERCASRVRSSTTTMSSVPGSECGSSSTVEHRGSARTGHGHGMGGY